MKGIMSEIKFLKQSLLISLKLGIIFILLASAAKVGNADSTTLYLDWSLDTENASGHLTITGYPQVIELGQTYKIEITLTLESGDSFDLESLNFKAKLTNGTSLDLGYADFVLDSTLNKNESLTMISHLKIEKMPDQHEGTLIIASKKGDLSTIPNEIKVRFKLNNVLNMIVPEILYKGDTLFVKGSIKPALEMVKINLTYLKPNGTEIVRGVSPDKNGEFNDDYKPDIEGNWWVKASWSGNEKNAATSSEIYSFEVQSPMPFLLIIGLAVFFGWVIGSLYILIYHKTNEPIPIQMKKEDPLLF